LLAHLPRKRRRKAGPKAKENDELETLAMMKEKLFRLFFIISTGR
jgi:hypothetical protein